jgi:hypothetical protein
MTKNKKKLENEQTEYYPYWCVQGMRKCFKYYWKK